MTNQSEAIDQRLVSELLNNTVYSRYAEVASKLLAIGYPIHQTDAFSALRSRSAAIEVNLKREHWSEGMRRLAVSNTPHSWLKACFDQDFHHAMAGKAIYQASIFDTYPWWKVCSLKEFTLALAVLFGSADAAISACLPQQC